MDWFKLSSKLPRDPRYKNLSPRAKAAYIEWACEVAEQETDGVYVLAGKAPAYVRELLHSGIVETHDRGYYLPGFLNWNRSRAEMDAERAKARDRGRSSGEVRAKGSRKTRPSSGTEVEVDGEGDRKADLRSVPVDPNPNQPTHDQLHLGRKLSEAITPGVIVRLNQRFTRLEVTDVMRSVGDMDPEGVTDWVGYLTGILKVRKEAM